MAPRFSNKIRPLIVNNALRPPWEVLSLSLECELVQTLPITVDKNASFVFETHVEIIATSAIFTLSGHTATLLLHYHPRGEIIQS